MNEIIIKQDFREQLRLTVLAALMTAASIFVLVQNNILYRIVGVMGTVFFGFCLTYIFIRLIKPKDVLIINESGFTDNSTLSSPGFVSWGNVDRISLKSPSFLLGGKFIWVYPNDNLKLKKVTINLSSTNKKYDDVLNTMQEYLNAYRKK